MQQKSLNILIAGEKSSGNKFAETLLKSKYLKKLYTTYSNEIEGCISIRFNTFKELCDKCKALQIDLVIVEEEKWILQGIGDVLKKHFINCIAFSGKLTNLAISDIYRRKLLEKNDINLPEKILLPIEYPVLVKANGFSKKANSLQEVGETRKGLYQQSEELGKSFYIEKFIEGEKSIITSIYDGRNLLTFPINNIPEKLINDYSEKLKTLLIREKADFIGFINSEIILSDGKLYNVGFNFEFSKPECKQDLLYIFNAAIYQKLDEIELKL